jgi:hypothetical protein
LNGRQQTHAQREEVEIRYLQQGFSAFFNKETMEEEEEEEEEESPEALSVLSLLPHRGRKRNIEGVDAEEDARILALRSAFKSQANKIEKDLEFVQHHFEREVLIYPALVHGLAVGCLNDYR